MLLSGLRRYQILQYDTHFWVKYCYYFSSTCLSAYLQTDRDDLSFLSVIVEIQKQIETYDDDIEYIKIAYPIEPGRYFMENTEHVSSDDNHHERGTFPLDDFGA
jgi:hypothetical protein